MTEEKIWERPASVPLPSVWVRYESKNPMPNGRKPVFRIQDYTEEWKDQVIQNMTKFFLRDEVISKSLKITENPSALAEFQGLIGKFLERKMALIAIVENLHELGDEKLPALAGCNVTAVVSKDEGKKEVKTEILKKILTTLEILEKRSDCFNRYQVNEYMYALGLSVDPVYRGHALGCEILKARFPLCKATGVKVTVTVFTGIAAQKSAEKAGYELIDELFYEHVKDENGKRFLFVEVPKSMKMMGKRIT